MRWLINYIRSCFCKHDWEQLSYSIAHSPQYTWALRHERWVYRCKKCGYKNIIES